MIRIGTAQLWVHDQDEALEFYTKKVGMEIRSDVTVPACADTVRIHMPGSRRNIVVGTKMTGTPAVSAAQQKPTRPMSWCNGSQDTPTSRSGSRARRATMAAQLTASEPRVTRTARGLPMLPLVNCRYAGASEGSHTGAG